MDDAQRLERRARRHDAISRVPQGRVARLRCTRAWKVRFAARRHQPPREIVARVTAHLFAGRSRHEAAQQRVGGSDRSTIATPGHRALYSSAQAGAAKATKPALSSLAAGPENASHLTLCSGAGYSAEWRCTAICCPAVAPPVSLSLETGAHGGTRTHDLLLRRQALYPAELRAHAREMVALPSIRQMRNRHLEKH